MRSTDPERPRLRDSRTRWVLGAALGALGAGVGGPVPLASQAAEETGWQTVAPGGETGCGFDGAFEFWVREGDPARLLVYLQGGGGCWDHGSCHPDREIQFDHRISDADRSQRDGGIFDPREASNPFREHTVAFVPYCTGDFHLGSRTVTYEDAGDSGLDPVTVRHHGLRNLRAVLDHLADRPDPPRRTVVVGGSAGAVASPILAMWLADLFPGSEVRQIGDGAAGLRLPGVRPMLAGWGVDSVLAAMGTPLPSSGDPLVGLYRIAAAVQPRIRFSQVATSTDARLTAALRLFGEDPERLPTKIVETFEELREAGVCFSGYLLPGSLHTVLWRPEVYELEVGGRSLLEVLRREVLERPCPGFAPGSATGPVESRVASDAAAFLAFLSDAEREEARFAFDDPVRTSWMYIPGERPGLVLKRMEPRQRDLIHRLLRTLLSEPGYLKVHGIMGLERYLQMVERNGFPRDPEAYVLAVFGSPGRPGPWGFRFEGHHVSLNYTSVAESSSTPFFLGANPATVPTGPEAGLQVLAEEEARARTFLLALSPSQREIAIVGDTAPPDLFTRNASTVEPLAPEGISMADLDPAQRMLLTALVEVYLGNLDDAFAAREAAAARSADPAAVHFSWRGGIEAGEPHYYRIQGPGFLIEYDHTSNHVHTVWRDPDGDFGRDLLREHHRTTRHEGGGGG